jgi:hypothetical protein
MSHYYITPLHGSQIPSYAAFVSRTPIIGNQTRMHDGSGTPHYGNIVLFLLFIIIQIFLFSFFCRHLVMMVQ